MNIEIVIYNSIYDDQICTLEKEFWSPDIKVNKSYLKWKYLENPYSDSPRLYLVLYGGKLIALRGGKLEELQGSEESSSSPVTSDIKQMIREMKN